MKKKIISFHNFISFDLIAQIVSSALPWDNHLLGKKQTIVLSVFHDQLIHHVTCRRPDEMAEVIHRESENSENS